jgi:hypothetical protein
VPTDEVIEPSLLMQIFAIIKVGIHIMKKVLIKTIVNISGADLEAKYMLIQTSAKRRISVIITAIF